MAHRNRPRPRGEKWPNGFPDGQSRVGRRQGKKSRLGQKRILAKRK